MSKVTFDKGFLRWGYDPAKSLMCISTKPVTKDHIYNIRALGESLTLLYNGEDWIRERRISVVAFSRVKIWSSFLFSVMKTVFHFQVSFII